MLKVVPTVHKIAIALKETNETEYWIDLLHPAGYLDETAFNFIKADITEQP